MEEVWIFLELHVCIFYCQNGVDLNSINRHFSFSWVFPLYNQSNIRLSKDTKKYRARPSAAVLQKFVSTSCKRNITAAQF